MTITTTAPDFTRTVKKLLSFQHLPQGWHYGAGGPIPRERLVPALKAYAQLLMWGLSRTDAFPGANGEVQVTAYYLDHSVAITAEVDGSFTVLHEHKGVERREAEHIDWTEAKAVLRAAAGEIWGSSGSSIQSTSTSTWTASGIWRSSARAAASQYSVRPAPSLKEVA